MERLGFGELTIWVNGERKEVYGGIHCKEVFEFKLNDVWIPARVEMDDDRKWYLVGLPEIEESRYRLCVDAII